LKKLRYKTFMKERIDLTETGEETLLSVSEYYGVKPRKEILDDGEFISRAESLEGYRRVKAGDLVMNYMLAWKGAYGVSKYEGIVSPAYAVFEINQSIADLSYIHYKLVCEKSKADFRARSKGIIESRLRLYPDTFLALSVELPDLPTQKAIAAFLDRETARIDQLIEKKQSLVKLLGTKRQAIISRAITFGLEANPKLRKTGLNWFEEIPETWNLLKLHHLAAKIGDGLHATPNYSDEGGFFFINGNNLVTGSIVLKETTRRVEQSEYEKYLIDLDELTVLMSINGTIGNVAFFNGEPIILGKSVAYIKCSKKLLKEYLFYVLQSSLMEMYFDLEVTGTTIFNLSLKSVRNIPIPLPESIEQQHAIVGFLKEATSKIDFTTQSVQNSISLLQEYRTALITAAVTGQIDLTKWGKNGESDKQLEKIETKLATTTQPENQEANV